jgi:molecular chaperone DnaJ
VRRVRQSILGQMVTAGPCPRCGGLGQQISSPCPDCRGEGRQILEKSYTVDIPAGVDTGSTLRLAGRGAAGVRGGGHGDLYVHVKVRGHERFVRQGYDLIHELHVPITQAALGAHLSFETLDGNEDLVLPRGTQTGRVFRLRGRGVPHVEGRGRGDLLVQVVVDTPTEVDKDEEELLRRLAELRGDAVAPPETGFFSKVRSAFK